MIELSSCKKDAHLNKKDLDYIIIGSEYIHYSSRGLRYTPRPTHEKTGALPQGKHHHKSSGVFYEPS